MAQQAVQPAGLKAIVGDKFVIKNGKELVETTFEKELADAHVVGLYFSAHWCPPCRGFTPVLTEVSKEWKAAKCRMIFVTSDQNEKAMKDYFAEMGQDWLAYPFGSDQIKALDQKFDVQGIPTLIIVDQNGKTVDEKGRATVVKSKEKAIEEWIK